MWEEESIKILHQLGIELTTTWWSKKKNDEFSTKAFPLSYWSILLNWNLYVFISILLEYSCKYKKEKASKNSNTSLNFKYICNYNVYLLIIIKVISRSKSPQSSRIWLKCPSQMVWKLDDNENCNFWLFKKKSCPCGYLIG